METRRPRNTPRPRSGRPPTGYTPWDVSGRPLGAIGRADGEPAGSAPATVRRSAVLAIGLLALAVYASTSAGPYGRPRHGERLLMSDVASLSPRRLARVETIADEEQLQAVLRNARARGQKVSLAGRGQRQGGHGYAPGGVVLDLRGFNRIRTIDTATATITVESGATWDEVQRALAPHGLALQVMPLSNASTVGSSLSANAHGRGLDATQMVDVVERFRLLRADGRIVEVGRGRNRELFSLVIGGDGLYGVILDVTLRVTPDELYQHRAALMNYAEFPRYFQTRIMSNPDVALLIARLSIDPRPDRFLREMVVATWRRLRTGRTEGALAEEAHAGGSGVLFGLARRFDWAKSLHWDLQKRIEPWLAEARPVSRNNAMRPPLAPVEFREYESRHDADVLQEYFVPVGRFTPFLDRLREILVTGDANVLSATVRYVTPNATPTLAYAPRRAMFAIGLLLNAGLSAEAQQQAEAVTHRLVEAALEHGGTYHLTSQLDATLAQLHRAYPRTRYAFQRKRHYDPEEMFTSALYERFGQPGR